MKHVLDHMSSLNSLCLVLGMDFNQTMQEIHPTLSEGANMSKSISNETISKLANSIQRLREIKIERKQKVSNGVDLL